MLHLFQFQKSFSLFFPKQFEGFGYFVTIRKDDDDWRLCPCSWWLGSSLHFMSFLYRTLSLWHANAGKRFYMASVLKADCAKMSAFFAKLIFWVDTAYDRCYLDFCQFAERIFRRRIPLIFTWKLAFHIWFDCKNGLRKTWTSWRA